MLFNGLDTYATIWFCDRIIATTDNQFRQYFFDITDVLQTCNSTAPRLELEFGAVPAIAAAIANQPGQRTWPDGVQNYFVFGDRQFVRKQQSDFGWDWSPALMPVGIWQDCYLVQLDAGQVHVRNSIFDIYRKGQLNNLPPNQEADWVFNASIDVLGTLPSGSTLRYRIVDLESGSQISSGSLQNVSSKDHVITGNTGLDGRAYKLWWPVGFGPQNLYNITVDVILGETTIASVTKRMGFRTIVLNQEPVSDADQAKGVAPGSYCKFVV